MSLIYHFVPREMRGDVLYPLNDLRTQWPDIYAREAAKYEGRKGLIEIRLPYLNCLWNDVIQFSAVHPALIRDAVIAAGHTWHTTDCFELDPIACGFSAATTLIYTYQTPWHSGPPPLQDFHPFSTSLLNTLGALPDRAVRYYQRTQKPPLLFAEVPHVLHKGPVATRGLHRITI